MADLRAGLLVVVGLAADLAARGASLPCSVPACRARCSAAWRVGPDAAAVAGGVIANTDSGLLGSPKGSGSPRPRSASCAGGDSSMMAATSGGLSTGAGATLATGAVEGPFATEASLACACNGALVS
ncbi:hypothetical protein D3C72_1426390 [compost metagenome]